LNKSNRAKEEEEEEERHRAAAAAIIKQQTEAKCARDDLIENIWLWNFSLRLAYSTPSPVVIVIIAQPSTVSVFLVHSSLHNCH
jgi:hypothetical protein